MANPKQVALLKKSVEEWNQWREENPSIIPDLKRAKLINTNLENANLEKADLYGAILCRAYLKRTNLKNANLESVNLTEANLIFSNLERTNLNYSSLNAANIKLSSLNYADLYFADLKFATLAETTLANTTFNESWLGNTILAMIDLSQTKGLETFGHTGPSFLDHSTLQMSHDLPLKFLRGCGLPDRLIENLNGIFLDDPIQFYSCFISYSNKDREFAERLHSELQNKGVRCWFAPEDLKIGAEIEPSIDEAIKIYDKLLLIISENSINSAWVRKEAKKVIHREEINSKKDMLFPIRLDNSIMDTTEQWADDIRRERHIGDFRNWQNHDDFKKGFERLLRDLKG